MKIIGNTVGMGLPKPDLTQTDPSKGDYVRGKDNFLKDAVENYLAENPVQAGATAEEAAQIRKNRDDIETLNQKKLSADVLPGAINDALAQAKASGEFDGEPGKDGVDGKDGYTPKKGIDYFDGEPGQPGKDGKDGTDGADGKTPVRGVDYWTDADKQEMVGSVLAALPKWTGGSF